MELKSNDVRANIICRIFNGNTMHINLCADYLVLILYETKCTSQKQVSSSSPSILCAAQGEWALKHMSGTCEDIWAITAVTFSVWMKTQLQVEPAQFTSEFLENPIKQLLNHPLYVKSIGRDSFYLRWDADTVGLLSSSHHHFSLQ